MLAISGADKGEERSMLEISAPRVPAMGRIWIPEVFVAALVDMGGGGGEWAVDGCVCTV